MPNARWFSFERLEVYKLAVEFYRLVKKIVADLPPASEDDAKQLLRSAKSMIRNICEGAGEFRRPEKNRFYRMALRSAEESGGTINILIEDYGEKPIYTEGLDFLLRIVPMLIKLCQRK
jgi:four helix bundle protein